MSVHGDDRVPATGYITTPAERQLSKGPCHDRTTVRSTHGSPRSTRLSAYVVNYVDLRGSPFATAAACRRAEALIRPDSITGFTRSGTRAGLDRHARSGWLPEPRARQVSVAQRMWSCLKPLSVAAQVPVGVVLDAGPSTRALLNTPDTSRRRAACNNRAISTGV